MTGEAQNTRGRTTYTTPFCYTSSPSPDERGDLALRLGRGKGLTVGMIVVDQPPANEVLVILDVLVEAGELNHLHDDKAGEQCDDKEGGVDAALHHDLRGRERRRNEFILRQLSRITLLLFIMCLEM